MNFEPTEFEKSFFGSLDSSHRLSIGDLSAARRKRIPDDDFALPGRRYPIDTLRRARNALARIAQFGSADEIRTVRRRVHARWPQIEMPEYEEEAA